MSAMAAFWIGAIALAIAVALLSARPLLSGRSAAAARAAYDAAAYRRQLEEIERDLERGALSADEAEGARREVARRLLSADTELSESTDTPPAPEPIARSAAAAVIALSLVGGGALYAVLGAPLQPSAPLATRDFASERRGLRPSQQEAEATAAQFRAQNPDRAGAPPPIPEAALEAIAQMETLLERRPSDIQGRLLLADAYASFARHAEAWPLLLEAVELQGEGAPVAEVAGAAELMILAAGGLVSREAADLLERVSDLPQSRYFLGLLAVQENRPRDAAEIWGALLREFPSAPFAPGVRDQLRQVALQLNVDPERLLEALGAAQAAAGPESSEDREPETAGSGPGPSAADIEAAAELSADDRAAMIDGMVAGLAARLEEEPDDLEGWLRLMNAYAVLERTEALTAAYGSARDVFASDPEALSALEAAATRLGAALPESGQ